MQPPLPLSRDLVLIGGGHAHALLLRKWGMDPLPGVRVTLVHPGAVAPYSGMLPGLVAGHYQRSDLEIDLVRLARFAGARLVPARATGLDRQARSVRVEGYPDIRYDILSIDVGSHTEMPEIPGFADFAVPAKPFDRFVQAWETWCSAVQRGDAAPTVCVIGAGLAGVELALAMHFRLRDLGQSPSIRLVDAGRALASVSGGAREGLLRRLDRQSISLDEGARVERIRANGVELAGGRLVPASFVLGIAGARAHGWLAELGLATCGGSLRVDAHLRSLTDPAIFAAGDCAHLETAPRPKAGVFAVRAAPILHANLRAALAGTPLRRFRPQRDYLKLVSLGARNAVADRSGLTISGPWVWRWKDRIDRRFMARFHDLPPMPAAILPKPRAQGIDELLGDKPLCGGCGAKVGRAALTAALAGLPPPQREDVQSLPGDDAAILNMGLDMGAVRQVLTTDHLRSFTEDPVAFARIAAVHALGDIWAMGARPQVALASVTLPRMHADMQEATLREILDSAAAVFRAEGADLVGGHTAIGAELTLGFTVTGLHDGTPITLDGAQPGDALLLTRPIGSGTLLAGEMQGKAAGRDVLDALASMGRSQGAAARCLRGARAMTDVTGFGLAGHLMGICEASSVGAELRLDAIPVYPGAVALAAAGVRSTLAPENSAVAARMEVPETPRAALLFDPQTAGGLLACVAAEAVPALLETLRQDGVDAAEIGRITDGPPFITAR